MYIKKQVSKKDSLLNFKKAKSHIDKIISMVENDEYCIDIMQQNLAVIGLLKSAHLIILENHLKHCFTNAIKSDRQEKKEEMVKEILRVTKLANK
ncbi:MAG: metal-sensitive transcriptional regulator [Actinobacteria bacterium]|nr:metal-sensitive transcriptional regulator [Actinomycetota bacterium]